MPPIEEKRPLLRNLDQLCYEDQERGGEGWVTAADLAHTFAYRDGRSVAQELLLMRQRGVVEARGSWQREYAPTEEGARIIHGY